MGLLGIFKKARKKRAMRKSEKTLGAKGYGMTESQYRGYTGKLARMSDSQFAKWQKKKGSTRIKARNLAGVHKKRRA